MIGTPETAEQIAEAALAGDEEALGRLFAAHHPAAYATAFRLLGSEADAADAVQEACLLAVRAIRGEGARPRGAKHFGAWFRRIVTNAALQRLRRRPRMAAVPVDELIEQLPAHNGEEPAEEVERREVRGDVLRALLALPDAQRAALTLREFEELSYDEIAEVLGGSRLSVQMLLFRARRNFRSAYEGLAVHPGTIGCPELAPLLSGLLDGEVGGKAWLKLSLHLSHCTHCRTELAELRKTRKLSALIPLIPLPGLRDWSAPATAGTMTQAATLAPITPGLAQGVLHVGPLAWAAAGVAAVGLGVTLATSASIGSPPLAVIDPPREIVVDAGAAGQVDSPTQQAFSIAAVSSAAITVVDAEDSPKTEPALGLNDKNPDLTNPSSVEVSGAQPVEADGIVSPSLIARASPGGAESPLLGRPAPPEASRASPAPATEQVAALQLEPVVESALELPAVLTSTADPASAVPDVLETLPGSLPGLPPSVPAALPTAVIAAVEDVVDRVTAAAATVLPAVATVVADTAEAVPTVVGQVAAAVPTAAAVAGQAVDGVQEAVPTVAAAATQAVGDLQGAVPTVAAVATQVGALPGAAPTVAAAPTQVVGIVQTTIPAPGGGGPPAVPQATATPRPTTFPTAPAPPTLPPTVIAPLPPLPPVPPVPTVAPPNLPIRP